MPDFAIIDSHVHFWDGGRNPVAWTRTVPALDRPFLPTDFESDRGNVELAAMVFVEADVDEGLYLKEAAWAAELAHKEPRLQAVVAHAPLHFGPAVGSELEKLAAQPIVKGVRRLIRGASAAALCGDNGFREAVRLLARHGLHCELGLSHDQLAPAIDLVAACPDVHFVLDHMAKPDIGADGLEPWASALARLAELDNVDCKISGAINATGHAAWSEALLEPYLAHALEVFGPDRVLFASDWPIMRLAVGYEQWVEVVDRAVAGWPEADRRQLFADNARRVYRL